jgi:hypothetical protein
MPNEQPVTTQSSLPSKVENARAGEATKDSPPLSPEALGKLPPEAQKIFHQMVSLQATMPVFNPVFSKIESGHIDKILDYTNESEKREHAKACTDRWFLAGYTAGGLLAVLYIIRFLVGVGKDDLLIQVGPWVVAVIGAGIGGYGIATERQRRQKN